MAKPHPEKNQHLLEAMLLAPHTIKSQVEALRKRLSEMRSREVEVAGTRERVLVHHAVLTLERALRRLEALEHDLTQVAFIEDYIASGLLNDVQPEPTS